MTPLTNLRAQLPCPTCGRDGPRIVTVRRPAPASEVFLVGATVALPDGIHEGSVSECSECWRQRCLVRERARAELRRSGQLVRPEHGEEEFEGRPLSLDHEGAYEAALQAVLVQLAAGAGPSRPGSARVRVRVSGGRLMDAEALDQLGATA